MKANWCATANALCLITMLRFSVFPQYLIPGWKIVHSFTGWISYRNFFFGGSENVVFKYYSCIISLLFSLLLFYSEYKHEWQIFYVLKETIHIAFSYYWTSYLLNGRIIFFFTLLRIREHLTNPRPSVHDWLEWL